MFYQNKKQETTEIDTRNLPSFQLGPKIKENEDNFTSFDAPVCCNSKYLQRPNGVTDIAGCLQMEETLVLDESENVTDRSQQITGQANTLSARLTAAQGHNYIKDNFLYGIGSSKQGVLKCNDKITDSDNINERSNKFSFQDIATNSKNNGVENKHASDNGLDKLTKKFSKIAVSDTSIPGKFRLTSNESGKMEILRRSASVENDFVRFSENIYESVKDVEPEVKEMPQKRKILDRIKRSDSDRILTRTGVLQREFRSEQKIKTSCENSPVLRYRRERLPIIVMASKSKEKDLVHNTIFGERKMEGISKGFRLTAFHNETSLKRNFNKDVKSDTDLSVKKHSFRQSGSCDAITLSRTKDSFRQREDTLRFTDELNKFRAKMLKDTEIMKSPMLSSNSKPAKARRSNSLLRRFSRESSKDSNDSGVEIGPTPKKRSLSFLKKMWKKKERKWEEDEEDGDESFSTNPNPLAEMQGPNSDIEDIGHYIGVDTHTNYEVPRPEPPPDYDEVNVSSGSDSEPPQLPPRHHKTSTKRPPSPWHDIPTNNKPVDQEPPALPRKVKKNKGNNGFDFLLHEDITDDSSGLKFLFREDNSAETHERVSGDLGEMLTKLSEINRTPLQNYHYFADNLSFNSGSSKKNDGGDPDYDIPRPHASLMATLRKESSSTDTIPATHFFSHYEDSLDPPHVRDDYERLTMAPDSLECDPWSLSNDGEIQNGGWSKYAVTTNTLSIEPTNFPPESIYQDSLNTAFNNNREDCITYHKGYLKLYS
ncbi:hypothetical protein AAG570_000383 [Ranatra chinensis]|uniref:Uncharacterized protein n=1 Tax=Ranatra chinensis TaxID=642074 RepID=A0ABD0YXL4_9HEMI